VSARNAALVEIIEPGLAALGYELVHTEFVGSGGGGDATLRVFIDAPDGITVDDCAAASRHLGVVLDAEDPIPGQYNLEISSPGVDRPLSKPEHFQRFAGERVRVQLYAHHLGRRKFLGMMTEADEQGIVVEVDGEPYELAYDQIDKARLEPEFD